jgi:o-succinylbenzoate synthase
MIRVRLVEQRLALEGVDASGALARDARRSWSERTTLIVVLEDAEGRHGLGEAAPLPDYSPDSLDEAKAALVPLAGAGLADVELGAPGSSRALYDLSASIATPSARFALESAVLDLWSRRSGEPAWALLARLRAEILGSDVPDARSFEQGRPVAALLPLGAEPALRHAEAAFARGIRCFKAKIGAEGAWSEELGMLRDVRRRFPEARLRVDANQSLSPADLAARLPALRELELEWLEEPTRSFPEGVETPLGVPVALDESLQSHTPDPTWARHHGVLSYVLKPTTLGGFVRSFELADDARSAGLAVALSHAYEGPVGFSAIAALALALGPGRPPDGLDRHPGISGAAALPALDAEHGRIRAWREPGFGLSLATLLERGFS